MTLIGFRTDELSEMLQPHINKGFTSKTISLIEAVFYQGFGGIL